jgi:hypothetical protein
MTPDMPVGQHGNSSPPEFLYQLLDLPSELLVAIAIQLAEDDELAASLACGKLREAVARTERRMAGKRLSTRSSSAFGSSSKLDWAVSCGMPLSAKLLNRAARLGQLEHLRWLRAHGCAWEPCDSESEGPCSSAAEGGHLSVLQWRHANGCPWDEWTSSQAAKGGHLAVLQYAHANGCPWDAWMCTVAAGDGHLAVLQWARANGCPWDADTRAHATRHGHTAVVDWARANGCP